MIRAAAIAAALLIAGPASAGPCAGLADTMAQLAQRGFTARAGGLIASGTVTVYINPKGRWAAIAVIRDRACILAVGTGWGPLGEPL